MWFGMFARFCRFTRAHGTMQRKRAERISDGGKRNVPNASSSASREGHARPRPLSSEMAHMCQEGGKGTTYPKNPQLHKGGSPVSAMVARCFACVAPSLLPQGFRVKVDATSPRESGWGGFACAPLWRLESHQTSLFQLSVELSRRYVPKH